MNRFARHSSNKFQPLSDAQLQKIAPSIFAEHAHESRSERYAYIPTRNLLSAMREQGFLPVQAVQSKSRIPGKAAFTKHQIRFNYQGGAEARQVGDSIPQVVMTNSHDGTSAYQLDLGLLRLICLNGMMVSDGTFQTLKIPHSGKVIDRVIEGSFQVIGETQRIGERVAQFRAVELSSDEQRALARAALQLRFEPEEGKQPPITEDAALRARRHDDVGFDLWRTFNRVQENVVRGGSAYLAPGHRNEAGRYVPARRMHTREVKGIDQSNNLNRALWRLAEEMRAIKLQSAA